MSYAIQHSDLIDYKVESIYRGANIKICLSNTFLNQNSNINEIFASELLQQNGYSRQGASFGTIDGIYNSNSFEIAMPEITANFTGAGIGFQFSSGFALLSGHNRAGAYLDSVDADSSIFTLYYHELNTGDRLYITPGENGAVPSGISLSYRYYVKVLDGNTFELYLDESLSTKVNINNTGSLPVYARYANGRVAVIITEDAPIQLLDGQSYSYRLTLRERLG